nr:hypothetical protein [Tanacetum cinerariifolium]
ILKNVVKRIPANYEQQDYATQVYMHRRLSNFDTLRLEVEAVSRLRVPAGFRHFTRGFMGHEDDIYNEVQQRHSAVSGCRYAVRAELRGRAGQPAQLGHLPHGRLPGTPAGAPPRLRRAALRGALGR